MNGGARLLPLILSLLVSPAGAAETAPSPSWLRLVEPLPCSGAIVRELSDWRVENEVLRAPSGIDGRPVYRIPTERLGAWVTLVLGPDGGEGTRLFLTDWDRTVTVTFDDSCGIRTSESSGPRQGTSESEVFTDRDLESFLSRSPGSMVYLWSPHLPLSVEGYWEAARAAEARGLGFVALVHPSADGVFAREAASAAGLPKGALRRLASVELLFRDLAVHAPSLLVFIEGRGQSPLPGYRSTAGYLEYLDALVAETSSPEESPPKKRR